MNAILRLFEFKAATIIIVVSGVCGCNLALGQTPAIDVVPEEIAKKWRLTVVNAEASVDGLGVVELKIADGKVRLAPGDDRERKWGYAVSELEFSDSILRFKIDFRQPQRDTSRDWFEGRFDPKFPDRIWGVIGAREPEDDDKSLSAGVRPAELNAAPSDGLGDLDWAMQRVLSPGIAGLNRRLNKARRELPLATMEISDDRRLDAYIDAQILAEFAASASPGRRKYILQCMQVRSAEAAKASPELVESWLTDLLEYATLYGPRYVKQLRGELANALSDHKNEDYETLVKRLRSEDSFPRN